jgi:hypothetical protein
MKIKARAHFECDIYSIFDYCHLIKFSLAKLFHKYKHPHPPPLQYVIMS